MYARRSSPTAQLLFLALVAWAIAANTNLRAQSPSTQREDSGPAIAEELRALIGARVDGLVAAQLTRLAAVRSAAEADPRTFFSISGTCFAPGADPAYVAAEHALRQSLRNRLRDPWLQQEFQVAARWSRTATDGFIPSPGSPTTLTWSYAPDGTDIPGFDGEPASPNVLIAFLNGIAGPPTVAGDFTTAPWHDVFVEAFGDWSVRTGLTIVYEPNDDGAAFSSSTNVADGQLGVRGDVRIGGHPIDGQVSSNTLAYNFFPTVGDMVIDTDNIDFYGGGYTPQNGFRNSFLNVIAHELGHGLGLAHVIPINRTKLMEPKVNGDYRGPQEDDYLAGNRNYGDYLEDDDGPAAAVTAGGISVPNAVTYLNRSIDAGNDLDYVSFSISTETLVDITLEPTGTQYQEGPQGESATLFDALRQNDLRFRLLSGDGNQVIATAEATGLGEDETATVPLAAGTYLVEIGPQSGTDETQMYDLRIEASAPVPVELVSFTAEAVACGGVSLAWATAAEVDASHFELRRRTGAGDWASVATVVAEGAGTYAFDDEAVAAGAHLYQLIQYDTDGTAEVFDVVAASVSSCAADLSLRPNPASGELSLVLANDEGAAPAEIVVYNVAGAIVHRVSGFDTSTQTLRLAHLPKGVYQVAVERGQETSVETLVLE